MAPRTRSSGRPHLSRNLIDGYKRQRVARALVELATERGVHQLTVSLLTKRARMSRAGFYELFENRDAALIWVLDWGNGRLKAAIGEAATDGPWLERVEAALESLIVTVEAHVELAELCLTHGSGADAAEPRFDPDLVQTLAGVLRPGLRECPHPGPEPHTEELLAYGILTVIAGHLGRGEAISSRNLSRELSGLAGRMFSSPPPDPDSGDSL